jgi:hypothetical protein
MKTRPLDKTDSFALSATWSSVKLRCYTPPVKKVMLRPWLFCVNVFVSHEAYSLLGARGGAMFGGPKFPGTPPGHTARLPKELLKFDSLIHVMDIL